MADAGTARVLGHADETHDGLAKETGRQPEQDHGQRVEPDRYGRQRAVGQDHAPGLHHHDSTCSSRQKLAFDRVEPPEEHPRQGGQVAVEIGNARRVPEIAAQAFRHGDHLGIVPGDLRVGMMGQVLVAKVRGDEKQPGAGDPPHDPVHRRASEGRAVRAFMEGREPVHHDGAMGQQGRRQPPGAQGKRHQVSGEQGGRQMPGQEYETRQVASTQQFAQPVGRNDIGGFYRNLSGFLFEGGHGSTGA